MGMTGTTSQSKLPTCGTVGCLAASVNRILILLTFFAVKPTYFLNAKHDQNMIKRYQKYI